MSSLLRHLRIYTISFTGRKVGSTGKFYRIRTKVKASSPNDAIKKLYDDYEHLSNIIIKTK